MADTLIARLEAATEETQHVAIYDAIKYCRDHGWITYEQALKAFGFRTLGAFLDAALTLVPGERQWRINGVGDSGMFDGHVEILSGGVWLAYGGVAPTPALALCIAALKAWEQSQ